ncbi:MAG: hypothetical protein WCK83_03415 [Burkholderiales bacterium]
MLNIKTLIAATVLTGVAAVSFAQAPAVPAKFAAPATTSVTPVAAPAPAAVASTPAKAKKVHAKKAAVAKPADAPAK